jgi:hypothetical protein
LGLESATAISDDGRLIVGTFRVSLSGLQTLGYAAVIPQFRRLTVAYVGDLEIGGYARVPDAREPPERLAANVEFFGASGGTFASGITAARTADPALLLEELGLEIANLQHATEPMVVWTFEYDGELDAPVEFTTQYPRGTLVPPEEITLFQWSPEAGTWLELWRAGLDPSTREVTAVVSAIVPRAHLAIGKTLAACADDIDNDRDGRVDWNGILGGPGFDPDCSSAVDGSESPPAACGLGAELALLGLCLLRRRARAV